MFSCERLDPPHWGAPRCRGVPWGAAVLAATVLALGSRGRSARALAGPSLRPPRRRPALWRPATGRRSLACNAEAAPRGCDEVDSATSEEDESGSEAQEWQLDAGEAWSPSGELERPALYVVAMPIGNLGDITLRALHVLRRADVIYAEDTRRLRKSLRLLGVPLADRPVVPCHAFSEAKASERLLADLSGGLCAALVCDAGTPLIEDPGRTVLARVREVFGVSFPVRAVPGASAVAAAISVAGLPDERYLFAGFLSRGKRGGRQRYGGEGKRRRELREVLLQAASADAPTTLVLYETPHRIVGLLRLIAEALEEEGFSAERRVVLCRELTKRREAVISGEAREVLQTIERDPMEQCGEFVVLVGGGDSRKYAQEAFALEV